MYEKYDIMKDGKLSEQQILFNYTSVDGADFNQDPNGKNELITFDFHVPEDTQPGIYFITTKIKTLEGPDEEKQIFEDTTLTPDEIPYREGMLDGEPGQRLTIIYTADEQTYVLTSGENKTFTVKAIPEYMDKATYDKFDHVEVDGVLVDFSNYTKEAGSLLLTFLPEYMDTLSVGDHEVKFVFSDGETTGILHVLAAPTTAPAEKETKDNGESNKPAPGATNGQSSTSDQKSTTNGSAVQTGSPEIAIFFVVILVMAAGIIIFTKKRKVD